MLLVPIAVAVGVQVVLGFHRALNGFDCRQHQVGRQSHILPQSDRLLCVAAAADRRLQRRNAPPQRLPPRTRRLRQRLRPGSDAVPSYFYWVFVDTQLTGFPSHSSWQMLLISLQDF